ncbi:MAG: glutamate--cysteine ligase, partial [Alphaproteobacteria bacterium]
PEARIKRFIEMRGADGGPWRRLCALPAFWTGILYDSGALDAAWDLAKGWDAETREALRLAAARDALDGEANGIRIAELAGQLLEIAEAGLKARARPGAGGLVPDESHFLDPLREILERRCTQADEMLARFHGPWGGRLDPIYEEYAY